MSATVPRVEDVVKFVPIHLSSDLSPEVGEAPPVLCRGNTDENTDDLQITRNVTEGATRGMTGTQGTDAPESAGTDTPESAGTGNPPPADPSGTVPETVSESDPSDPSTLDASPVLPRLSRDVAAAAAPRLRAPLAADGVATRANGLDLAVGRAQRVGATVGATPPTLAVCAGAAGAQPSDMSTFGPAGLRADCDVRKGGGSS